MLKNKIILALLLLGAIYPSVLSGKTLDAPQLIRKESSAKLQTPPGAFTAQEIRRILTEARTHWPQYNYGTLRSAYNAGTLTIEVYSHPNLSPAYIWVIVRFGGLEVCLILNPA